MTGPLDPYTYRWWLAFIRYTVRIARAYRRGGHRHRATSLLNLASLYRREILYRSTDKESPP